MKQKNKTRTEFITLTLFILLFILLVLSASSWSIPIGYVKNQHVQLKSADQPGGSLFKVPTSPVNYPTSGDTVWCTSQSFRSGTIGGSDCWGWEGPDGREYAIMGVSSGVAFYNVTDDQVVQIVDGPQWNCGNIYWRDMVTYGNYCYCVSECTGTNDGLMVIDMSNLPNSVSLVRTVYLNGGVTSHNMTIDTAKGYAYIVQSAYHGFNIYSLANPSSPSFVNQISVPNIHDLYARNDTVWVAEGNNKTFSAWNVANKNSPSLIVRISIPTNGYVHNIWPSEDGKHVVTTEETGYRTIKIWNVENYSNVQLVSEMLGANNLAHNAHFEGDSIWVSHYESGVIAYDVTDIANPTQVFQFDTWDASDNPDFNGCWGVYPHTNSGKVYLSNDYGILNVLKRVVVSPLDTLKLDSVIIFPSDTKVSVNVRITNTIPIKRFVIPFSWAGDYDLKFDSVTTTSLRTDYFDDRRVIIYDEGHSRGAVSLTASLSTAQPDLQPGSGPIATLHFTINGLITNTPNQITLVDIVNTVPVIETSCYDYSPPSTSGWVALWQPPPPCCTGFTGNANGSADETPTVSDISTIIDLLFGSGALPACLSEADADISGGTYPIPSDVTVADISRIIDFLFGTGTQLPNCP